MSQFKFTHKHQLSEDCIEGIKSEISKMKESGFILHTMAMAEFQKNAENDRRYPNRFLHKLAYSLGKNPRKAFRLLLVQSFCSFSLNFVKMTSIKFVKT